MKRTRSNNASKLEAWRAKETKKERHELYPDGGLKWGTSPMVPRIRNKSESVCAAGEGNEGLENRQATLSNVYCCFRTPPPRVLSWTTVGPFPSAADDPAQLIPSRLTSPTTTNEISVANYLVCTCFLFLSGNIRLRVYALRPRGNCLFQRGQLRL